MGQAFITRRGGGFPKYTPIVTAQIVGNNGTSSADIPKYVAFLDIDLSKNYIVMACTGWGANGDSSYGFASLWLVEKGVITTLVDGDKALGLSIDGTSLCGIDGWNRLNRYSVVEVS